MANVRPVGEPIKIALPLFTFPVVDRVRVADAVRLHPDGMLRLLRDGDGLTTSDFYAIDDAEPGDALRCVPVGNARVVYPDSPTTSG